jgi:hypothetical protein
VPDPGGPGGIEVNAADATCKGTTVWAWDSGCHTIPIDTTLHSAAALMCTAAQTGCDVLAVEAAASGRARVDKVKNVRGHKVVHSYVPRYHRLGTGAVQRRSTPLASDARSLSKPNDGQRIQNRKRQLDDVPLKPSFFEFVEVTDRRSNGMLWASP